MDNDETINNLIEERKYDIFMEQARSRFNENKRDSLFSFEERKQILEEQVHEHHRKELLDYACQTDSKK